MLDMHARLSEIVHFHQSHQEMNCFERNAWFCVHTAKAVEDEDTGAGAALAVEEKNELPPVFEVEK